jgi:hypothetical protein
LGFTGSRVVVSFEALTAVNGKNRGISRNKTVDRKCDATLATESAKGS